MLMEADEVPECLRQSPQQCREIRINARVPIEWALPLYGFLMPLIVAITILTNSFIVVVLSHRSLRTPTNFVLGAMAITELLTGLLCLPWLLYYYTFGGYRTDEREGLPAFWCSLFPYLATSLPSIFHTAAIWLTVYLAVQRYIYICVPKLVRSQCTIRRSKQIIICICVLSLWIYAPELFASYNQSFRFTNPRTNRTRSLCLMSRTALIQLVGNNLYHLLLYAVHTILVHTLPCILLVFFTWRLIAAIREADKKHSSLIGKHKSLGEESVDYTMLLVDATILMSSRSIHRGQQQQQQQRKLLAILPDGGGPRQPFAASNGTTTPSVLLGTTGASPRHFSVDEGADLSPGAAWPKASTASTPQATAASPQAARGSLSESKRVQGLRQNTRMLLAVILLFLVTEIPAAMIFSMHVGTVALKFTFIQQRHYAIINRLLIVRNVLIVISYPLRFAIYCGMSAQFREVVQQMLAKRKRFFQHFAYGKLHANGGGRNASGNKGAGGKNSGSEDGMSSGSPPRKASTSVMLHGGESSGIVWRNNGNYGGILLMRPENGAGGGIGRRATATETTIIGECSRVEDDEEERMEEEGEGEEEEDEEL